MNSLSSAFPESCIETFVVSSLAEESLQSLEADCYWCFSKLLDGIQDNYTFAQPGIQTRINQLKELIGRIDSWVADLLMFPFVFIDRLFDVCSWIIIIIYWSVVYCLWSINYYNLLFSFACLHNCECAYECCGLFVHVLKKFMFAILWEMKFILIYIITIIIFS